MIVQREPSDNPEATDPVTYASILKEHDVGTQQREVRQTLLKVLSSAEFNGNKEPNGTVVHISHSSLSSREIPILGDVLLNIGDVETLNLILHSPGGDGSVVEKFVDLCRSQCKRFRVIIPNEAKSAATLVALGADEIVMGPPSELGPIDAQIEVFKEGVWRYVSAQSYIEARDSLLKTHAEQSKKNEDTGATMQLLATLDLPFITECEHVMGFSRDVATKLLNLYMFKSKTKGKKAKIDHAVQYLSSVQTHMVHSRSINGRVAKTELELKVRLLGKGDEFWKKIWEYYTRAELHVTAMKAQKMFETEHDLLTAGALVQN